MAANGKPANGRTGRSHHRKRPPGVGVAPTATRVPKHGHGLLRVGNPGNVGGGRTSTKLLEEFAEILGLSNEEMRARLRDPKYPFSTEELARIQQVTARYLLPSRVEHSGPAGGPIPIEAVHADVSDRLRRRLGERKAS